MPTTLFNLWLLLLVDYNYSIWNKYNYRDSTITKQKLRPLFTRTFSWSLADHFHQGCSIVQERHPFLCIHEPVYVTFDRQNMIDGAAFMGVGFDGRGEYSPESRNGNRATKLCWESNVRVLNIDITLCVWSRDMHISFVHRGSVNIRLQAVPFWLVERVRSHRSETGARRNKREETARSLHPERYCLQSR